MAKLNSAQRRKKKNRRVRNKVSGTHSLTRLFVFKSSRHIYAQLIDDFTSRTLTGVSSQTPEIREEYSRGNEEAAYAVGEAIADWAQENGIEDVVFDRGGFEYHGRIKAVAEGARENGLQL